MCANLKAGAKDCFWVNDDTHGKYLVPSDIMVCQWSRLANDCRFGHATISNARPLGTDSFTRDGLVDVEEAVRDGFLEHGRL
jgi:hypothetical protein